jgi:hypothetical protein
MPIICWYVPIHVSVILQSETSFVGERVSQNDMPCGHAFIIPAPTLRNACSHAMMLAECIFPKLSIYIIYSFVHEFSSCNNVQPIGGATDREELIELCSINHVYWLYFISFISALKCIFNNISFIQVTHFAVVLVAKVSSIHITLIAKFIAGVTLPKGSYTYIATYTRSCVTVWIGWQQGFLCSSTHDRLHELALELDNWPLSSVG